MNSDQAVVYGVLGALLIIALFVLGVVAVDRRQEYKMAEKGYCYQAVDRSNNTPTWQYQVCK